MPSCMYGNLLVVYEVIHFLATCTPVQIACGWLICITFCLSVWTVLISLVPNGCPVSVKGPLQLSTILFNGPSGLSIQNSVLGWGYKSGTCRPYVRTCPLDFKLVPGLRVYRKNWTDLPYVVDLSSYQCQAASFFYRDISRYDMYVFFHSISSHINC